MADQRGDDPVAHLGPRRESEQAQQPGLLGRQSAVGQPEGGADTVLAVVEVVEPVAGLGQFRHEFGHRLARVLRQEGGRDLQGQREVPAEAGESLSGAGVVRHPAVLRVGDPQGTVEESVRLARAELVQRDEPRAELRQAIT
ncbi:hypothetical protein STENM36S_02439 [Streptomyces tendae]